MAVLVQITGYPGEGKSYASRNMDPKTTFFIDADSKGLAWTGWRKDFNTENKNYVSDVSNPSSVYAYLEAVSEKRPEVNVVIVDTISTMMSDTEVTAMKKPSFDAWRDYAVDIYELYGKAHSLRDDLIIVFVAHPMLINDKDNPYKQKLVTKVGGKKLTTMNLGGKINYNLYTEVKRDGKGGGEYFFLTQSDGVNEARSVHGVL